MKITLISPLFPPDIAEPALYTKELSQRLAKAHEVHILTYGKLPEKVEGVPIHTVDKRMWLPVRLLLFLFFAVRLAWKTDILYVQNGPSAELPASLAVFFSPTKLVFHIIDIRAHEKAKTHLFHKWIEKTSSSLADCVIKESPLPRPEVLPYEEKPEGVFNAYEKSWDTHLRKLEDIFVHTSKK